MEKVIATIGMEVYFKEDYKRLGKIVCAADSKRPGKVQVQWEFPNERLTWVRVTMLRHRPDTKKIKILY